MAAPSSPPTAQDGVGVMIVGQARGLDAVERTLEERQYKVVRVPRFAKPHPPLSVVVVGSVMSLRELENALRGVWVLAIDTAPHIERWVQTRALGERRDFVRVRHDLDRESPDAEALGEVVLRVGRLCQPKRADVASPDPSSVEELHDRMTGRLDAKRVALFLGIPLRALAEAMGRNYRTVHKTPAAEALQESLGPIVRIADLLMRQGMPREDVRAWLRTPHAELEERTPWSLVAGGRAEVVRDLLLASSMGLPT